LDVEVSERFSEISLELDELLKTSGGGHGLPLALSDRAWSIFKELKDYENCYSHLLKRKPWSTAAAIFYLAGEEAFKAHEIPARVTLLQICKDWNVSCPCLIDNVKLLRIYLLNIRRVMA